MSVKIKCINKRSGSIGYQGDISNMLDYSIVSNRCPMEVYKWEVLESEKETKA